jgi:hypothetical protein
MLLAEMRWCRHRCDGAGTDAMVPAQMRSATVLRHEQGRRADAPLVLIPHASSGVPSGLTRGNTFVFAMRLVGHTDLDLP